MSDLFKASREDGRSDWRVVYDLFTAMEVGEQIPHETLLTALGTDDRARMYRAVARANRELWARATRSVDSVKGYGYRILRPSEHAGQAMVYKRKSRRQLSNAIAVANATDDSSLDPVQRNEAFLVRRSLMVLAQAMDRTVEKLADHEERIARLEGRQ